MMTNYFRQDFKVHFWWTLNCPDSNTIRVDSICIRCGPNLCQHCCPLGDVGMSHDNDNMSDVVFLEFIQIAHTHTIWNLEHTF